MLEFDPSISSPRLMQHAIVGCTPGGEDFDTLLRNRSVDIRHMLGQMYMVALALSSPLGVV